MSQSPPGLRPPPPRQHFLLEVKHSGPAGCSAVWLGLLIAGVSLVLTALGIWVTIALAKGWL